MIMDFNKTHPELKEGEVFLTNGTVSDFHKIRCESKRLGGQAYSKQGNIVEGLRPVFKKKGDKHDFNVKRILPSED